MKETEATLVTNVLHPQNNTEHRQREGGSPSDTTTATATKHEERVASSKTNQSALKGLHTGNGRGQDETSGKQNKTQNKRQIKNQIKLKRNQNKNQTKTKPRQTKANQAKAKLKLYDEIR